MKLPELTQTLLKAQTAEQFADTLRKSWYGYGASQMQGTSFTITFGADKSVTPKTFYEAMAFLKFRGQGQDGARVYRLGQSPYQVTATLADNAMMVMVTEGIIEATKETALAFLEAYRHRLKQGVAGWPGLQGTEGDGTWDTSAASTSMQSWPDVAPVEDKFNYFRSNAYEPAPPAYEKTGIAFRVTWDAAPYDDSMPTAKTDQATALYIQTDADEFIIEANDQGRLLVSGPRGMIRSEQKDANTLILTDVEETPPETPVETPQTPEQPPVEEPETPAAPPAPWEWDPTQYYSPDEMISFINSLPDTESQLQVVSKLLGLETTGIDQTVFAQIHTQITNLMAENPQLTPEQIVGVWAKYCAPALNNPVVSNVLSKLGPLGWIGGPFIGAGLLWLSTPGSTSAGLLPEYEQMFNVAARLMVSQSPDTAIATARDLAAAITILKSQNDSDADSWLRSRAEILKAMFRDLGATNVTDVVSQDLGNLVFERGTNVLPTPHQDLGVNNAGVTQNDLAANAYYLATGDTAVKIESLTGDAKTKAIAEMKALFPNEGTPGYVVPAGYWITAANAAWTGDLRQVTAQQMMSAYQASPQYTQMMQQVASNINSQAAYAFSQNYVPAISGGTEVPIGTTTPTGEAPMTQQQAISMWTTAIPGATATTISNAMAELGITTFTGVDYQKVAAVVITPDRVREWATKLGLPFEEVNSVRTALGLKTYTTANYDKLKAAVLTPARKTRMAELLGVTTMSLDSLLTKTGVNYYSTESMNKLRTEIWAGNLAVSADLVTKTMAAMGIKTFTQVDYDKIKVAILTPARLTRMAELVGVTITMLNKLLASTGVGYYSSENVTKLREEAKRLGYI